MSFYDIPEAERSRRGLDADLAYCLKYNPQPEFDLGKVECVLAVVEGEYDEKDWHWLLELTGPRYAYLTGGCDYTGWD